MAQGRVRHACELVAQGPHEAGFADAWFAAEQNDPALALLRLLPAVQQKGEFLVAPDQRGRRRSVLGVEPALGRPLADDVPRPHGFRKTLEVDRTEIAVYEGFSEEAPCRLGNHDAAGLGEPLQPGGQVRSLTDDRPLAGFSFTDQFADNDQTGCDADASGQRVHHPAL